MSLNPLELDEVNSDEHSGKVVDATGKEIYYVLEANLHTGVCTVVVVNDENNLPFKMYKVRYDLAHLYARVRRPAPLIFYPCETRDDWEEDVGEHWHYRYSQWKENVQDA